jgi:hypothetical protein
MHNVEIAAALMFCFGFLFVTVMAKHAKTARTKWGAVVYLMLGGLGAAIGCFGIVLTMCLVFHANGTWR